MKMIGLYRVDGEWEYSPHVLLLVDGIGVGQIALLSPKYNHSNNDIENRKKLVRMIIDKFNKGEHRDG